MNDRIIGQLMSKNKKTAKVTVVRYSRSKIYGKHFKITKRYIADNPHDIGDIGSDVELIPSRPISRNKRWQLSKIIK